MLAPLASSLVQQVIYSVVKGISRRGVRIAGRDLDDENSKRTHWVLLFIGRNTAVYFDSFEIECIPRELLKNIEDKSVTHNIFRIQDNQCIMCRFYCIAFIECMLAGKTLLDYIDLFSPND